MIAEPVTLDDRAVLADRLFDGLAIRSASGDARRAAARRGTGGRAGASGRIAHVRGRGHDPSRASPQVRGDHDDHGRDDDQDRDAAQVPKRRVDDRLSGTADVAVGDATDDHVPCRVHRQACQQEDDDHADPEVDEHPPAIRGQPERERHEQGTQDDQHDHDKVEDADDVLGRRQARDRHQPDRAEVGRQRDAEGRVEALGENLRRIRSAQVGELHIRRDQPHRLQLGQRRSDDREGIERQIAVDDAQVLSLAAQQADELSVAEGHRLDQRVLQARILEGDLEPRVDPLGDGGLQGTGQRLDRIREACLEAALDVERVDDLVGDARRDRIGDGRLGDGVADEGRESVGVEGDLVGPDRDRRHQDRQARQQQDEAGQDASAPGCARVRGHGRRCLGHCDSPTSHPLIPRAPLCARTPQRRDRFEP